MMRMTMAEVATALGMGPIHLMMTNAQYCIMFGASRPWEAQPPDDYQHSLIVQFAGDEFIEVLIAPKLLKKP